MGPRTAALIFDVVAGAIDTADTVEVDFDDDVPRNDATIGQYARTIARMVRTLDLAPLDRDAVVIPPAWPRPAAIPGES